MCRWWGSRSAIDHMPGEEGRGTVLNITLEPGEELCNCESWQRLAHEPMSLRVMRSRYHKVLDAGGKTQPPTRETDGTA